MNELDLAILEGIARTGVPIGQGALSLLIRKQGISTSTPTVGRKLQELEDAGLVRKVSVEGRVITDSGLQVLGELKADAQLRESAERLLETLKRDDKSYIFDLLRSRMIIESETAALAAQKATITQIRLMESIVSSQAKKIAEGELGVEEDVSFHSEIAQSSGNLILHSLVGVLRNHQRYNLIITSMRAVVGTKLVVEHTAILDAIKARSPESARDAMRSHLESLINDLNKYWVNRAAVHRKR